MRLAEAHGVVREDFLKNYLGSVLDPLCFGSTASRSSRHDARTGITGATQECIVRMRFGLGMNSDHPLEEVGQQFLVTRRGQAIAFELLAKIIGNHRALQSRHRGCFETRSSNASLKNEEVVYYQGTSSIKTPLLTRADSRLRYT
jgi:hypothetical protein